MNETILVAEDDPAILAGVSDLLALEGYRVETAVDGEAALAGYRAVRPDLVLLDVMMPKVSGYDVCREIRREDPVTPILMLTAKGAEVDRVVGLELGADDYVVKPFGMAELLARVRSALRRGALSAGAEASRETVEIGDATVDFARMTVTRGNEEAALTPKETALFKYLVEREGRVVSREELLEAVWGIDCEITTRSVDQHMLRLRQKLEPEPANPKFFHTAHGAGYRFERTRQG